MIKGNKVIIRPKKLSDAENDYRWQTDTELSALDAMPPLALSFEDFLDKYVNLLRHPLYDRITFAVETPNGRHIGNCVYYNIDKTKGETEIGIMIGDRDYWNEGYGTDTITALIDYLFRHLKFKRIHLKTLETNPRAQRCFQKCNLTPYGHLGRDGYQFLLMEIPRSKWQESLKR